MNVSEWESERMNRRNEMQRIWSVDTKRDIMEMTENNSGFAYNL